ncbi:MAG: winged helix DNA-binding domain-containing protein [Chloroflexota bacterium]|nr:winged helix DNA-binding domain-containing protein [Chloroflexota bacterium]
MAERVPLAPLDAIERLVGLQAQLPNPPYIGLWTRLRSFQRADLTSLLESRQVVKATMMRSTLHLLTAGDYVLLRSALQPALTRALHAFFAKQARGLDIEQFVAEARAYIQEQPRTFVELRAKLAERFPAMDPALMAYAVRTHLPLVQVFPGGTWGFTGSPAHAEASAWLVRSLASPAEGLPHLIMRYLTAFGPATIRDIQAWSGLVRLQGVIEELRPVLYTFRDEQGNELFDLPDSLLPPAHIPSAPRFLPEFDNLILSHADRRRVVADVYRPAIFLSAGRVRATFLVDGFVCGTWKTERTRAMARLVIEPFEPLLDSTRRDLLAEGERLLHFVENDAETFEISVP